MTLKTAPISIIDWLGAAGIRNSDNLKIPARVTAKDARILAERGEFVPSENGVFEAPKRPRNGKANQDG